MFCNGIVCCNILSPLCFVASLNNWKQSQQTSNKSRFLPFSDHSTFFFLFCFLLTFCLRKFSQERNYISMYCWQRISVLSQINAWSDLSWNESLLFFQVWLLWFEGRCRRADDDAHVKDLQIEDMRQQVFDEMIKASLTFVKTSCSAPFLFNSTHVATWEMWKKIKLAGDSDPTELWSLCRLTA